VGADAIDTHIIETQLSQSLTVCLSLSMTDIVSVMAIMHDQHTSVRQ